MKRKNKFVVGINMIALTVLFLFSGILGMVYGIVEKVIELICPKAQ